MRCIKGTLNSKILERVIYKWCELIWRVWEVSPDTDILTKQMQVEMAEGAKALAEASRQVARDGAAGRCRTAQEAKTNLREALLRVSSGARSHSKTPGNP